MGGPRPRALITEGALRDRVAALGGRLARDYAGLDPVVVGVLKGAALFVADLVRAMPIRLTLDFVTLSSYAAGRCSTGRVSLVSGLTTPVEGRPVLVVEDIVDSGASLAWLLGHLGARNPRDVRVCALLDKPARRRVEVAIDYRGFVVPDVFVVGYGLDHAGAWRNLPYVGTLDDGPAGGAAADPGAIIPGA